MGWDAGPNIVALLCACVGKEWEGRDLVGTEGGEPAGPIMAASEISVALLCLRALRLSSPTCCNQNSTKQYFAFIFHNCFVYIFEPT